MGRFAAVRLAPLTSTLELMTPNERPIDLSEIDKRKFDAFVKESDQIVKGIHSIQETQRRMIGFLPPALTVGLPLLLRPATDVPKELTAAIFLGFGFMFLFFVTNYIGLTRGILRLSKYQMEYLTPKINNLLGSNSSEVFYWEDYIREGIRKPLKELIGYTLIHGAEFLLLLSPSVACFGLGLYYTNELHQKNVILACSLVYAVVAITTIYFAWLTVKESRMIPARYVASSNTSFQGTRRDKAASRT